MKKKTSWVATAVLMGLPLMVAAQANPADPGAAAPALKYQSAFSDYKLWQDIQAADWRIVVAVRRYCMRARSERTIEAAIALPQPSKMTS